MQSRILVATVLTALGLSDALGQSQTTPAPHKHAPETSHPSSEKIQSLVQNAASAKAVYSRRNYQLGITLSAFKRAPYPDQKEWPKAFPVCSNAVPTRLMDDAEAFELQRHKWKGVGVVMCKFFYPSDIMNKDLSAGLMLGNVSPHSNDFYFYKPRPNSEPLLFFVRSVFPSNRFDETLRAFKDLLGEPTLRTNRPVQNRTGSKLQNTLVTYENELSYILLMRYSDALNKSVVHYVHKPLLAAVEKADEAVTGRPRDRL